MRCQDAMFWMLSLQAGLVLGANILVLLPVPSTSHGILIERLLQHLSQRGHHVTYITPFLPSTPIENAKIVHIPELTAVLLKGVTKQNSNLLMTLKERSAWVHQMSLPSIGYGLCEHILQHAAVQAITGTFDLLLAEIFVDESLLAGFSFKFNVPIVAVSTMQPGVWASYLTGNPVLPSYIPDPFLGVGYKMNFWDRFTNTIFVKAVEFHYMWYVLPRHDAIMRKYFGNHLPPIEDILKNTSLVLINHHHSIGFPRPYGPNLIEVGGFHIKDPEPLPKELQSYLDGSRNGVLYFSLGTNAHSAHMPQHTIEAFLKAFSRMEQNVLWKFETDLHDRPENVRIAKWLPQSDILAHPNVKLFVSHGGLLSTIEAVQRGVPIVGVPLFADQHANMKQMESVGLGTTIKFDDITEELVYKVLSGVISDPKYKEVATARSKLLKDRPMSAIDSAVWWVEYVIRHKGASNLRSAAQDLDYYQLHLIDVYVTAIAILVAIAVILVLAIRSLAYTISGFETRRRIKKEN